MFPHKCVHNVGYFVCLALTKNFFFTSCICRLVFLILCLCLYIGNSGDSSRVYIEILMIVLLLVTIIPPFVIELQAAALQMIEFVRIFKNKWMSKDDTFVIKRSCTYKMKKRYKRLKRMTLKWCKCCKWCCVEDYMHEEKQKDASEGKKEEEEESESEYDSDDSDFSERQRKKVIVVEIDPMETAEKPKDEILRLRKELLKQGFTTKAVPMRGMK